MTDLPDTIANEQQLDEIMTEPSPELVETMRRLDGDLIVLGVGGKMGLTLARLARRASDEAGVERRVIGVSRFSDPSTREWLEAHGVETVRCDLLDRAAVDRLPKCPNVAYMAGRKFGTSGDADTTWIFNTVMPGIVAERFAGSRIVAFSTGCVYPLVPVGSGGSTEDDPPRPVGEYAQSCLGRERVFEYYARTTDTPTLLFRLNYAVDLRYGVLVDIARKVRAGEPVDVTMGHFNVIWQGDANERALRCLELTGVPARPLNVTGPETLSVRKVAMRMGEAMGKEAIVTGEEAGTALVSDASRSIERFGRPRVDVETMIRWTAHWIARGGRLLGKPTHFEVRDGKF
jgi:nucleoside-diphosphate-sugar epimerase